MSVKNQLKLTAGILAVIALSGCEKYLDFEGDDAKPRLVLNGVFTVDSAFTVELSNSAGYIDNRPLRVLTTGKVAVFSSDGTFIDSLYHTGEGIYRSNAVGEANKTYIVQASVIGLGTVSASDYIPSVVPIASWDTTIVSVTEYDYTDERLEVTYTVSDPSGIANYYAIEAYRLISYYISPNYDPNTGELTLDTIYFDEPEKSLIYFSTTDPILINEGVLSIDQISLYSNSLVYSDELFDGRLQSFRILLDGYLAQQEGSVISLELKSCSEAYFKYKRSLDAYFAAEGDPFAQPAQVYNNILGGGLGIWAGYGVYVVDIER